MQIIWHATDDRTNTSSLIFYGPDALPDARPTMSKHWVVHTTMDVLLYSSLSSVILIDSFTGESCLYVMILPIKAVRSLPRRRTRYYRVENPSRVRKCVNAIGTVLVPWLTISDAKI